VSRQNQVIGGPVLFEILRRPGGPLVTLIFKQVNISVA